MKIRTTDNLLWLGDGQLLRLEGASGWRIRCRRGRLWLTQCGDARDHVLAAGDSLTIGGCGLVLLEGFGVAAVELLLPSRRRWIRNGWRKPFLARRSASLDARLP